MPAKMCKRTFEKFEKQNPEYALNVLQCPADSKSSEDIQPAYNTEKTDGKLISLNVFVSPLKSVTQ